MLRKDFQNTKPPIVVCLSGGLDSSILLAMTLGRHPDHTTAVSFNYGQRHQRELVSAITIAQHFGVRHKIINIDPTIFRGSSQTDASIDVPHGHYTDDIMRVTVVPNRNSLFLNYAAAWAISIGANTVAYAAHAGDHAIYPDCRPAFVEAMAKLLDTVSYEPLDLFTPFVDLTKGQVAGFGSPDLIRMTYSCYEGRENHCGLCGTCVERKEALEGFDPTVYEA
jgi:7-cyano-7-deazaguanine synthase